MGRPPLQHLLAPTGLCLLLLLAAAASAGAHKHMPRMHPAQQQQQALEQDPRARPSDVRAAQVLPPAPLNPACVPKYTTDLVVPPPMPVSAVPMAQEGEAKVSIASYDADDEPEVVEFDRYEHPVHVKLASREPMTEERRNRLRQVWSLDEEYYNQEYYRPSKRHSSDTKRRSSSGNKGAREDDDASPGDRDGEQRAAAPAPAPVSPPEKKQRREPEQEPVADRTDSNKDVKKGGGDEQTVEQVPPPLPVFTSYDVSVKQIAQNVFPAAPLVVPGVTCPAAFAPTNVLAYGPANIAGTPFHNWPGFTIEAQRNVPNHIRWTNDLKTAAGTYLPHILSSSIDQTIHWANPAAVGGTVDSNPCHACSMTVPPSCATNAACTTAATTTYTGPVPIITHVHGQTDVPDFSDGYTEAWYMPAATNLAGFSPVGSWYNTFQTEYTAATAGKTWTPGSNTAIYNNVQRAAALWYHDHTLGLTRTNVYAGMAGFFLLRSKFPSIANGPELPGLPYPAYDGVIPLNLVRELPLAIQDRSFTTDSQLWYPVANHAAGTTLPTGPLHPKWIPEYSATIVDPVTAVATNYVMMTVNGRTYPRHISYPDAYRLRLLNGCNSRTLQLRFARSNKATAFDPLSAADTANLMPFYIVGNDDGFWPSLGGPFTTLQMGPAERYDVVIDFSGLLPGEFVYMLNNGPETDTAIYNGNNNGVGLTVHTAQIMRFDITALPVGQTAQPFTLAQQVALNTALAADYAATGNPITTLPATQRQVSLMENLDPATNYPLEVLLGTATNIANGLNTATPQLWMDPVTADSPTNAVSVWDIINLSADSHPIHFHNVEFEYLGRFQIVIDPLNPLTYTKTTIPVPNQDLDPLLIVPCAVTAANPTGRCPVAKDTQLLLAGTYTRVAFRAPARNGLYVWHCHLVEHEDNEMMVPHCFGTVPYLNPKTNTRMCPLGPNKAPQQLREHDQEM